jgi:hypothetical protein
MGGLGIPELLIIILMLAIGAGVAFLALLGLYVLMKKILQGSPRSTKNCPFCAENIQAEARLCRFCGKDLETSVPKL